MGKSILGRRGNNMIKNRIEIDNKTTMNRLSCSYSYMDKEKLVEVVRNNPDLKYIQLSKNLPEDALTAIDSVLEIRPDLIFRIYGMYNDAPFDLARLSGMSNIRNLRLDMLKKPDYSRFGNIDQLSKLKKISNLYLDIFGNVNMRFLNDLREIDLLYLLIESGSPQIDKSFWEDTTLKNIELGNKAVEYAKLIKTKDNDRINRLVLFQTTINDISFINHLKIKELRFINCRIKKQAISDAVNSVDNLVLANCKYDTGFINSFIGLNSIKIVDKESDIVLDK